METPYRIVHKDMVLRARVRFYAKYRWTRDMITSLCEPSFGWGVKVLHVGSLSPTFFCELRHQLLCQLPSTHSGCVAS
jgi:hypothetical protein